MTAADPPRSPSRDLVPSAPAEAPRRDAPKAARRPGPDEAIFTAQVMGQTGVRRGLKGGPPVLKQARSAYLETEYSGPNDRRPPTGLLRKTEI